MTDTTTRYAGLPDLDAVAALFDAYRQFYEMPADAARARAYIAARMQKKESVILVAENGAGGGPITGFCQLYPSFCSVLAEPILTLYDLYVRPDARRSGAARALMLAAERHATEAGAARMDLQTAESNRPAQALYESLGWTRDTVFRVYTKAVLAPPAGIEPASET
jgi:ribosomal protein S18 acetylase RimI-like enzyme